MVSRNTIKTIMYGLNLLLLASALLVGDFGTMIVYAGLVIINLILLFDSASLSKANPKSISQPKPIVTQVPAVKEAAPAPVVEKAEPEPPAPVFKCKHCEDKSFDSEIKLRRHIGMKHLDKLDI